MRYQPSRKNSTAKTPSSSTMETMPPTTAAVAASPTARGPRPAPSPARQPTRPMASPKTAALARPPTRSLQVDPGLQLLDHGDRREAERAHHHGHAQQAGQVHQQRQHRHHQHRRQQPRQHQPGDRVDPHDAQRVDLLVHRHGAELGGIGRAGAAGEDHGGHQRPQLAQQGDADEVGDEDLGAELPHRDGGLEGQDQADQEAEQRGQPEGAQPGLVQVPQHLGAAQPPGRPQRAEPGDERFAEEGDLGGDALAALQGRLADAGEEGECRLRLRPGAVQRLPRPVQQGLQRPGGEALPFDPGAPPAPAAAAARRRRYPAR